MQKLILLIVYVLNFLLSFSQNHSKKLQLRLQDDLLIMSSELGKAVNTNKSSNPARADTIRNASLNYLIAAQKQHNLYHSANAASLLATLERSAGNRKMLLYYDSLFISYARVNRGGDTLFNAIQSYSKDLLNINQPDKALTFLKQASDIADSLRNPKLQSKALLNMGFYYFKKFKPKEAIKSFLESSDKASETGDRTAMANCEVWIAYCEIYTGRIDSSAARIFKTLEYYEKNRNFSGMAECFATLGFAYQCNGNIEKSLNYNRMARNLYFGEKDNLKIADQSLRIASLLSNIKQYDSAMYFVRDAEDIYKAMHYNGGLALAKTVTGTIYFTKGETEKAKEYFSASAELNKVEQHELLELANTGYTLVNAIKEGDHNKADSLMSKVDIMISKNLPKDFVKGAVKRLQSNNVLKSKEEKDELEKTLKSSLINFKEDNEFINPYTNAPTSLDSSISMLNNKQLLDLETKYRTRIKDDSLRIEKEKLVVSNKDVELRNIILFVVVLLSLFLAGGFWLQFLSRRRTERDKAKIELLQDEIHHRVKNNLGVIGRLVDVAGRNAVDAVPLSSLKNRIKSIESLHNHLYSGVVKPGNIFLQSYCEDLCKAIGTTYDTEKNIQIKINASEEINGAIAEKLGLIINELVTNSFKYAFDGRESGFIHISAKILNKKNLLIEVRDNGVGFDLSQAKTDYGMKLIKGLSNELKGRFSFVNNGGTCFTLEIPV